MRVPVTAALLLVLASASAACGPTVYRRADLPQSFKLHYVEDQYYFWLPPKWNEEGAPKVDGERSTRRYLPAAEGRIGGLPYLEVTVNQQMSFDRDTAEQVYKGALKKYEEQRGLGTDEKLALDEEILMRPVFTPERPLFLRIVVRRKEGARKVIVWTDITLTRRGAVERKLMLASDQYAEDLKTWTAIFDDFHIFPAMDTAPEY